MSAQPGGPPKIVPPFEESGLMRRGDASINDYKIDESERRIR